MLINKNANVDTGSENEETALFYAAREGKVSEALSHARTYTHSHTYACTHVLVSP